MVADELVERAFGKAAPEHFAWQTRSSYVAACERDLVRRAFLPLGERPLDVGCGEGATLYHLGAPLGAVGVDLFEAKLELARRELPLCRFATASVYALPFEAESFDQVIVRDLLHHLSEPERALDECARVLTKAGRIDILEPCRYNPLVFGHGLLIRAERGELRSTPRFIEKLLKHRFELVARNHYQALPVHRLLFHPDFGAPQLADSAKIRDLIRRVEQAAERLWPHWAWAYIHMRAVRR